MKFLCSPSCQLAFFDSPIDFKDKNRGIERNRGDCYSPLSLSALFGYPSLLVRLALATTLALATSQVVASSPSHVARSEPLVSGDRAACAVYLSGSRGCRTLKVHESPESFFNALAGNCFFLINSKKLLFQTVWNGGESREKNG